MTTKSKREVMRRSVKDDSLPEQVGSGRPARGPGRETLQDTCQVQERKARGDAALGGTRRWARGLELSSGAPPSSPATVASCTPVCSPS